MLVFLAQAQNPLNFEELHLYDQLMTFSRFANFNNDILAQGFTRALLNRPITYFSNNSCYGQEIVNLASGKVASHVIALEAHTLMMAIEQRCLMVTRTKHPP